MSEPRVNQQSAVDAWYRRLYNDLEVGYHDTLAWSLVMMGRADAQLSRPAYRPFFDRYKDELLKAILTMIANKDDELRYSEREQNEMMVGVRKLGLDWPELNVIERSLNAGKKISEDVSNAFVSRMADLFHGDNPMAYREFDRKLKTRNQRDRQAVLFAVKPAIIRWMLRMIRDGAWWAASDFSGMLVAYGVEWSELDTIHKSLRAESNRIREDEEWPFDDEPPRHILDRMQAKVDEVIEQLYNAAAEGEEHSAWRLLLEIRDMVDNNLFIGDVNLKDEGIDLNPVKDGIVKRLLMLIRAGKLRHARSIERLIPEDWPELTIIRNSLEATDNLRESDGIHPIVKNVSDKIKAAIDRGDNHGPGYAIQVLSRVDPKTVYDGMKHIAPDLAKWFDKLADSDPRFAFEELLRISYYTADLYPELIKILDKHKDDVLRFLLSDLKRNGPNRYVSQTVKYLSDQGLRWDELNVIRKSLDTPKPKQLGG